MSYRLFVAGVAALALSACTTQLPAATLVVLTGPEAPAVTPMPDAARHLAVRIGEVRVPEYLDTYSVLVRSAPHAVTPLDSIKWAEKLPAALTRLLRESATVAGYLLADSADLVVLVDVDRFEPVAEGQVVLAARWTIVRDGRRETILGHGARTLRTPISDGTSARIAAMDAAARQLAGLVLADLATAAEQVE